MGALSEQGFEDLSLADFLSVKDSYSGAIADFKRFLDGNHMALEMAAVRAYFVHLNASPFAARTKAIRRQAVKARLRAALSGADLNRQARLRIAESPCARRLILKGGFLLFAHQQAAGRGGFRVAPFSEALAEAA